MSASSGFDSSQELSCRFVLNTPVVFQAKRHFIPHIALRSAAENWQTQSSLAKAAGRGFSSLLKHRCLLLKSALEEEGNLSMTLLFLIKMLLEMSPRRHCLVVLLRIVKDWPLKALLLLTVEEKVYKQQCCTCLTSAFVKVML